MTFPEMARTKKDKPSTPRGRPPRINRATQDDSRGRLLDAAIHLFARYGYDPVSTVAVAKATGLTQSMVHYHFGSKEKLWKEAIRKLMRDRGATFPIGKMDLRDLDHISRLKFITRTYVKANAADPNLARIMMHEGMAKSPRLNWLVEEYVQTAFSAFDAAIKDAIAAGVIRNLPVRDVTNIIVAAGAMTFSLGALLQQLYKIDILSPKHVDSLTDSIVTVLFQGLESVPRSEMGG